MGARFAVLERFIQEKMAETHLPAVSIALVERGETVYQRGFGFRDSARGLPATPRTLYGIGSVTKSFTCLAIMQLQEQGKLRVDDRVDRYLPLEVRPWGQPILLGHFMTHSSGIPALAYAEAVIRHAAGAADKWLPMGSYDDMLTFVNGAGDWVQARPGERWFYLNEGYILLGAIIEKVSGQPYVEYVAEHILDPLGMSRSVFRKEQVDADPDAAVPYVITKDKTQLPSHYLYGRLSSDGGMISSVEDMARYVAMYLADGRGPQGRVISPESLRAMTTPYVALVPEVYPASERIPTGHAGYGLFVYPDFFGHTLIGIRESESRMRTLGYNVWLHKYIGFLVAGAFGGFGGVFWAYYNGFVSPSDLELATSVEALLMVALGGRGTLVGPALGAGIIVLLKNLVSVYTHRWLLILGAVYIGTIVYAPEGIVGAIRQLRMMKGEKAWARG